MVGDDQFESEFLGQCGFRDAGDAAVDRDDEAIGIVFVQRADRVAVESVTFFETTGDVVVDVRAGEREAMPEDGRGGHAVDVVVAVDGDSSFCAEGGHDAFGGNFRTGKQRGIVQIADFRPEEFTSLVAGSQVPGEQHLRQQRRAGEFTGQLADQGRIVQRVTPVSSHPYRQTMRPFKC